MPGFSCASQPDEHELCAFASDRSGLESTQVRDDSFRALIDNLARRRLQRRTLGQIYLVHIQISNGSRQSFQQRAVVELHVIEGLYVCNGGGYRVDALKSELEIIEIFQFADHLREISERIILLQEESIFRGFSEARKQIEDNGVEAVDSVSSQQLTR